MEPQGDLRKGLDIKTRTLCQGKAVSLCSNLSTWNGQGNILLATEIKKILPVSQTDTKREVWDLTWL